MRTQIGAAWSKPQASDPKKTRVDVLLDLGLLGNLPCRLVEVKAETEKHPTHKLVYNEGEADGIFFGAFWTATAKDGSHDYLRGELDFRRLGKRLLRGGVVVDFEKHGEPLRCKIVDFEDDGPGESGPDMLIMRFTPKKRATGGDGAGKEDGPPVEELAPDIEEDEG